MWNLKCNIVPLIERGTAIVTRFMKKFGSHTRKTFNIFTTKDSYTSNITHNMENTAVWKLKPEQWGSLLVQEKYQEEKACDKRRRQQQQQQQ
jgi:GH25 family lysozyme M1 (1,4-beta-N-acetylmuramidase)